MWAKALRRPEPPPPATSGPGERFRIVVIEDDPLLAEAVARALEHEGFGGYEIAADAETGLKLIERDGADLVVLDIGLPGIDGLEACRRLRGFSDAYVIMLSGRDSELERVVGLSVGADDYMTKPFYASELMARIRAMRRRPRAEGDGAVIRCFGELEIDPEAREATVGGRPVELSRTEFDLLDVLSENPRLSLSRRQLLDRIWGPNYFGDGHAIDVHVSNLRRKLGDSSTEQRYVRTVRGHGFRMGPG